MNENNTNPKKPRRNPAPKNSPQKRTYRKKTPVSASSPAPETTVALHTSTAKKTEPKESAAKTRHTKTDKDTRKTPVRIIPLGGLNEIGKNMTVFECCNDMFILDCGLAFPDNDMPGVDIVLPDFNYVERNASKVRGIVITHGHEDHIGGLAYLLKKVNVPVYATKLTIGLIESKLKEHGILEKVQLITLKPRKSANMGCMSVEFIKVNHSIPDAVGMAIHTPAGVIVHTGDFKIDFSPIDGEIIDLARFSELGSKREGVLALMADSTNAERPGYTHSEKTVGQSFNGLFQKAEGKRIVIATFSSNIHRIQQIINCAVKYKRKVVILGRSMVNVINVAIETGHLKVPEDIIVDIEMMPMYDNERIVLITTGSQGEPMSALTRMAMHDHRKVSITPMDFIIISATPIPGNEKYVTRVVNELLKSGAEVVYEAMYEVHVSGHACQEELKMILALTKPKFFIPVHGEYKHLKKHADLAVSMGIPKQNIIIAENGDVIETDNATMKIVAQVPSGRVLVDGSGIGDVGSVVLHDRKILSREGLIAIVITIDKATNRVVSGPDLVSRGFVYVKEAEELMKSAKVHLIHTLNECSYSEMRDWSTLKTKLRDSLGDFILDKTMRKPMILPIIMEV